MRNREESYDVNTLMKYKLFKLNNIKKEDTKDETKKKEFYKTFEEYSSYYLRKKESDIPNTQYHNINFNVPEYKFEKRTYISNEKPIKFHESAYVAKLDPGILGEITSSQKTIKFETFMAMFDNKDEIKEIDIKKLLNIDDDNVKNSKNKLLKIIKYVNDCKSSDNKVKNQVLSILNDLLKQFDKNEDNIKTITNNIQNIDDITYSHETTKVTFQNK